MADNVMMYDVEILISGAIALVQGENPGLLEEDPIAFMQKVLEDSNSLLLNKGQRSWIQAIMSMDVPNKEVLVGAFVILTSA